MSKKELVVTHDLEERLKRVIASNNRRNNYYYQKNKVKELSENIGIQFRNLGASVSWATDAVDVINEKIDMEGYYNPIATNLEAEEVKDWLNTLYKKNYFDSEQKYCHKDAFITGTSFYVASAGRTEIGEPEVIWTAENSNNITVSFDSRTREITAAFRIYRGRNKDEKDQAVLWLPNSTITYSRYNDGEWEEIERDDHDLGLVSVVLVSNDPDSHKPFGRSLINPALMDTIDHAQRILRDAEVLRDRTSAPMLTVTGLSDEDQQGIKRTGGNRLSLPTGDVWSLPTNISGDTPIVPSLNKIEGTDPGVVLNTLNTLIKQAARAAGLPPSYFGLDTVNPTSADAIYAAEAQLIKRADQRIRQLNRVYKQLAFISLKIAGKEIPEGWDEIQPIFKNPMTMTANGSADWLSKLNAIGFYERELPDYQYRQLQMSDAEITEHKAFLRKKASGTALDKILNGSSDRSEVYINETVTEE